MLILFWNQVNLKIDRSPFLEFLIGEFNLETELLDVMGKSLHFSAIFAQKNRFCDFLVYSLKSKLFQKGSVLNH